MPSAVGPLSSRTFQCHNHDHTAWFSQPTATHYFEDPFPTHLSHQRAVKYDKVTTKIEYWVEYVLRERFTTVDELIAEISYVARGRVVPGQVLSTKDLA